MQGASAEIRIVDGSGDLRTLRNWLNMEPPLRGRVQIPEEPIKPGHMGGITETVTIALSSGGAGTVLVKSLFDWLSNRQRGCHARLTLRDKDGRRADIEIDGLHDLEEVTRAVSDFLG